MILPFVVAFIILLAAKFGLIEWCQTYSPKLIAKLCSCEFCLSFWLSIIVGSFMLELTMWWMVIVSTVLTRKLL